MNIKKELELLCINAANEESLDLDSVITKIHLFIEKIEPSDVNSQDFANIFLEVNGITNFSFLDIGNHCVDNIACVHNTTQSVFVFVDVDHDLNTLKDICGKGIVEIIIIDKSSIEILCKKYCLMNLAKKYDNLAYDPILFQKMRDTLMISVQK